MICGNLEIKSGIPVSIPLVNIESSCVPAVANCGPAETMLVYRAETISGTDAASWGRALIIPATRPTRSCAPALISDGKTVKIISGSV